MFRIVDRFEQIFLDHHQTSSTLIQHQTEQRRALIQSLPDILEQLAKKHQEQKQDEDDSDDALLQRKSSRMVHLVNVFLPPNALRAAVEETTAEGFASDKDLATDGMKSEWNTLRRNACAILNTLNLERKGHLRFFPVFDDDLHRTSASIGDTKPVPFVRDIIESFIRFHHAADDDTIICLTNADIILAESRISALCRNVRKHGCSFSFRRDFTVPLYLPVTTASESAMERAIIHSKWYVGADLFAFTIRWWKDYGSDSFPDMLLGRAGWDWIMRCVMAETCMTASDFVQQITQTPLANHGRFLETPNAIFHEKHDSFWEQHDSSKKPNAGNVYNLSLANKWFVDHHIGDVTRIKCPISRRILLGI